MRGCGCSPTQEMTIIMVMTETLPLAEIKAHLSEIVDRIEEQHERVTLTRNGRPAAVLLSPEDLEALEDTLELLADPRARREIERARADVAAGKGVDADALAARLLPDR
jgi:antitoxin YefM